MIQLTYNELHGIISESISSVLTRYLLLESQESKSIDAAKKLYIQRTGQSVEEADNFVRIILRNDIPTLRSKGGGKFILGVTRMYLDGQLRDANSIARINSTLKYVSDSTHINQYDRNLNGLSAQELIERFAPVRANDMKNDREALGKTQFNGKKEYKVIRIDSFEQIRQYGKYNDWCLAQDDGEGMYNIYTADGVNQLYLILRDGFENEPEQAGPDAPYDSYGLSMMTVIVDPDGQMVQSTTRWNHQYGSSDSAFTTKTISETIGRNFYEVFKPNTKFKDALESAIRKLENGEPLRNVFDDDWHYPVSEGMTVVRLWGKYNYLTPNRQLLLHEWVDGAKAFYDGIARIHKNNRGYSLIDKSGNFITDRWFDSIGDFSEGFANVYKENMGGNLINTKGELLLPTWCSYVGAFNCGFAIVSYKGDRYNFVDKNGQTLLEYNVDGASDFVENIARIYINSIGFNFVNLDGRTISEQWFNEAMDFQGGLAGIYMEGKGGNFINVKGEILSKIWFENVWPFKNKVALVKGFNDKYNFLNKDGKILFDTWFDGYRGFDITARDFVMYLKGKGILYVDTEGKIWF